MGATLQLLPKLRPREIHTYCSQLLLSCLHTHSCHTQRLERNRQGYQGWRRVSFCICLSQHLSSTLGTPHTRESKTGPRVWDKVPHQHSCSFHGWRHQILFLYPDHGCSLLFPALEGLGVGALRCAWGLPCQNQGYVAGQERTDKLHLPHFQITEEFMPS